MDFLPLMLAAVLVIMLLSWVISKLSKPRVRLLASFIFGTLLVLPCYIWLTTFAWQGFGANSRRLFLLQVIVTGIAIFVRRLRFDAKSKVFPLLAIAAFTPFIWHVMYSNAIIIHMVYDAPLHGQAAWLLCSQVLFLLAVLYCPRLSWEASTTG